MSAKHWKQESTEKKQVQYDGLFSRFPAVSGTSERRSHFPAPKQSYYNVVHPFRRYSKLFCDAGSLPQKFKILSAFD